MPKNTLIYRRGIIRLYITDICPVPLKLAHHYDFVSKSDFSMLDDYTVADCGLIVAVDPDNLLFAVKTVYAVFLYFI